MRVTGIGQCSHDYLLVVDEYPHPDTKKEVLRWDEEGGGPVATALVTLSRLGVECSFHGVVGDDPDGEKIRRSLTAEGVDVSGLRKREGSTSQIAFIVIEKGTAKRTIFWKKPSGDPLREEEMPENFLSGADFLLIDGLMKDISLHAAREAKAKGIPVMLDAGGKRPGMIEVAENSDYIVASEDFAKGLGWDLTEKTVQRARENLGAKVLTVTMGERGSVTADDSDFFLTPAFPVDAVDTTGAGDVFHGGYIYGLLRGWRLRETVVFASAVAAIKCRKVGGRAGIATAAEVAQFLAERGVRFSLTATNGGAD